MNYLLLLLPILAQAHITLRIIASTSKNIASVEVDGHDKSVISDKERETFQLSDERVKSAVTKYFGERPNDVYLKSPTPWNDLYSRFGWPQVRRILYPSKATIIGIRTQPVIISTQEFTNNSTSEVKFNAAISQHAEDTVSNSWSKGGEFSILQEISYSIEFAKIGASGTTSISYTSQWGEESIKSQTITVGSTTGIEVSLQPGKSTQSTLSATKGTMEVQVDYVAKLEGSVACNHKNRYKEHYFWKHDINDLLSAEGLPKEIVSRELMKIGIYSNVKVNVISIDKN